MEPEIRDFYIENAHRDKDYEYEEFMRDARSSNALIYVFIFNDVFSEMLGDVVVKDKRDAACTGTLDISTELMR